VEALFLKTSIPAFFPLCLSLCTDPNILWSKFLLPDVAGGTLIGAAASKIVVAGGNAFSIFLNVFAKLRIPYFHLLFTNEIQALFRDHKI
jgi:hypothetical protein